ncbi:aspartate--tRNA ligase, mitochondrial-like isoform X2 [Anneissia japonica]|nr:aspartate--tRNA ligase, mitochondrial-like isoform X2 [Anneissia japonica]
MVQQLMDASLESVVKVTGFVQRRPDGLENEKMSTGDIEVVASDFEILNPCKEALPFQVHDFQKVKEPLRMQHRYLDLRNIKMQQNLRLRSKVANDMRQFLCIHGFVEVETPTLFRRTPGGAREFIVPSQQKGKFYTLPQSPQQFKQLLMVGGIDRYFQFARCYRNEGARIDRQPEFTQVDIEMSFIEQNDILNLTEELINSAWPEDKGQLQLPFPRMSYSEAINKYGSDKPDTRFGMLIHDVTSNFDDTDLSFLSKDSNDFIFRAIKIEEGMKHLSNRELKVLELEAKNRFDRNITFMKLTAENEMKSPISKYLSQDVQKNLCVKMEAETGDIVILGGGNTFVTCSLLGHLRKVVASLLERKGIQMRDPDAFNFVWVNNFPLFTPKEGGEVGLESTHHPFTAPVAEHMDLIHTNPGKVYGEHYDLVLNGFEIAGGSIRIHNEQLQRYVLENVLKEDASSMNHLLQALQSGCPPHGGIAIGFDRFMAILCGESSIREVIAFPKTGEGNDLMCNAPIELNWEELNSYHIRLQDEEL